MIIRKVAKTRGLSALVLGGLVLGGCGSKGSETAPPVTPPVAKPDLPVKAEPTQPPGWKLLVSEEGNFQVLMPVETENRTNDVPTALGKVKSNMITAESKETGTAYVVMYSDYPAQVDKMNKQKMLDDGRNAAVKKRKLVSEKQIKIDGYPGRELVVNSKEGNTNLRFDMRMSMVNRRLYQMIVVSPDGKRPAMTSDFFDSFKITKTAAEKN